MARLMTAPTWCQYNIEFPDRGTAQHVAAHDLRPALNAAQDAGLLRSWWFMRKQPWKLRYLPEDPASGAAVAGLLDKLAAGHRITSWAPGIYEPETTAFGGEKGMGAAHDLFHHDSVHLLARAAQRSAPALGQRETTVLLCSVLLRAAGLDWYEQGDVWGKVAELRPAAPGTVTPGRAAGLAPAIHRLMTVHARPLCVPGRDGPLAGYDGWVTAFEHAGQSLADLSRHGRLERGLRAVLAHHIIFHANRAGLSVTDQGILAALASGHVLGTCRGPVFLPDATTSANKVGQMTTLSDDALSAGELRDQLTDRLLDTKVIRTAGVETAFRQTPRHLFLPGVPLDQAYADSPVYTKQDAAGASISAASQPWLVAGMLEQLGAQPGERIMEAGAGTGYNAAIMAAIVGETGHVTTIDVDEDLVEGAREHLTAAAAGNVEVILGDGALGYPQGAPYDRIIATVGAFEVPAAWLDQLAPAGRLVVPLRLRGTSSRSIIFERGEDGWRSQGSQLAVFMPLRGIADDARRIVTLTPQKDVTLQVHKDQAADDLALAGVLDTGRHEDWTGVIFPPDVPYEWMELWLCLRLGNALMRMNVEPSATGRGQVTPMFPWGSMATTRGRDLAYLTTRPAPPAEGGGKLYEVGVIGHGPAGQELAHEAAEEVRTWDKEYRHRSVQFELPDNPATSDPASGRFVLDRPAHPITITWQ
jgi:protein-L-isoaspartate(D-aspartate) O-methyltransferase